MNINEIKRLSAEYVIWTLDKSSGYITFPNGEKKDVSFFRRAKSFCTIHWDLPQSLEKALELLIQSEWTMNLNERGNKFDDISLANSSSSDEYYFKDVDGNFVDDKLASEMIVYSNKPETIIHSANGVNNILLTKHNDEIFQYNNNKELFLKEIEELLNGDIENFKIIKRNLEPKSEPKREEIRTKANIGDDPIPF